MRRTSRQIIADLLEVHDPRVREAFIDAVREISDRVPIGRLQDAISRGDVNGAIELINVDDAAFEGVAEALRAAYIDSGRETGEIVNGVRTPSGPATVFRFSARNIAAERFLASQSSELITRIANGQRETIRETLTQGLVRGDNPRRTALDIAGRIDRSASNRREGGIIGLTQRQTGFVGNARAQLESGDPAQLRAYLRRELRDARSDRLVIRAINDGTPLTRAQIDSITARYSDRLLRFRAETVSRTETLRSLQAAQYQAYRQAIDAGQVDASAVRKRWVSAGDLRVRLTHVSLNNTSVGFEDTFTTTRGNVLRFPLDTELGAGGEDVIQCRCVAEYRIDFTRGVT